MGKQSRQNPSKVPVTFQYKTKV